MLSIPGNPGCTCDGWSRREFMRVGGAGLFGVALGDILRLQALGSEPASDAGAQPSQMDAANNQSSNGSSNPATNYAF